MESHPGIPLSGLVRCCANLTRTSMLIDLAATELLGVPVVVLRDRSPCPIQPTFEKLSAREREVARLIAAGFDNVAIGRELGISVGTVKDHVHHALSKTGLKSRTELAATLAREGV
jgi:DNA-binding NarL/FixJ family response regulator